MSGDGDQHMPPEPSVELIELWVSKARRNLEMAEGAVSLGHWESCVFWCEQAVEVYLKALFLATRRRTPPRTHHVVDLGAELGLPADLREDLVLAEEDYMAVRYPDAWLSVGEPEYDGEVAGERLSYAKRLAKWVEERTCEASELQRNTGLPRAAGQAAAAEEGT